MQKISNFLDGKKTYIVAAATIVYALVTGWSTGHWTEAMEMVFAALGFSALRSGVKKSEF